MAVEMTRLSERGQIVIPTEIRRNMRLKEGERFIITGLEDTIILRKLDLPQEKLRLINLLRKSRKKARKFGFSERQIEELIEKTRRTNKKSE